MAIDRDPRGPQELPIDNSAVEGLTYDEVPKMMSTLLQKIKYK
jgi:hypothetical protein